MPWHATSKSSLDSCRSCHLHFAGSQEQFAQVHGQGFNDYGARNTIKWWNWNSNGVIKIWFCSGRNIRARDGAGGDLEGRPACCCHLLWCLGDVTKLGHVTDVGTGLSSVYGWPIRIRRSFFTGVVGTVRGRITASSSAEHPQISDLRIHIKHLTSALAYGGCGYHADVW